MGALLRAKHHQICEASPYLHICTYFTQTRARVIGLPKTGSMCEYKWAICQREVSETDTDVPVLPIKNKLWSETAK